MSTESPLFQSALELLGHSITQFNAGDELDRKLVILHLANSIELLLKDLLLSSGASIYKNPKETISVHACLSELEKNGTVLPCLNKIELLIDERNALQHRFGSPNELTSIFYMNIAVEFFKEILQDQYGLEFDEILVQYVPSSDWHAFTLRIPSDESELENLKKLANVHPLGAMLSTFAYLEKILGAFSNEVEILRLGRINPLGMNSHRLLNSLGVVVPDELQEKMNNLRRQRNMAAHGQEEPTKEDVVKGVEAVSDFESFLSGVDKAEIRANIERMLEEERNKRGEEEEFLKYTGDP